MGGPVVKDYLTDYKDDRLTFKPDVTFALKNILGVRVHTGLVYPWGVVYALHGIMQDEGYLAMQDNWRLEIERV